MDDAQRRDMRAGRIERCLAADMIVKEWCALNRVAESSLYKCCLLYTSIEWTVDVTIARCWPVG